MCLDSITCLFNSYKGLYSITYLVNSYVSLDSITCVVNNYTGLYSITYIVNSNMSLY